MRQKLVCITDVPTPYRIHLFKALNQELRSRNVAFEVLFMASTVPTRFWRLDSSAFAFPHKIVSGLHLQYNGATFHFNPSILWSVLREPPDWLMLGGAWHSPTTFSLAFAVSLLKANSYTILWLEANRASMAFKTGLVSVLRRAVMQRAKAFAVPGRIAKETIIEVSGLSNKPFLQFPNLVDEETYGAKVGTLRLRRHYLRNQRGLRNSDLVLLWSARLHECTKGILNFLKAVMPISPERVKILIAGEGPDRKEIEAWIAASRFNGVRLLGQQSENDMLELFALADVLMLPSLNDPNPLSVIEGLWAGLPLLISNRCGNWPEAIEEGKNGWIVDPASHASMQTAFNHLLSKSPGELSQFGQISLALARERFSTELSVNGFVNALLVHQPR